MIDIDFERLRPIGLNLSIINQLSSLDCLEAGVTLARVTHIHRDRVTLHDGAAHLNACISTRLHQQLHSEDASLAVGDWVLTRGGDANADQTLVARMAPLTQVARRANDGRRQALANNIDTALLVMGLDHDFNPRRMERTIALVQAAGVAPVAVLTKADIGSDIEARVAGLQQRLPASVPLVALNALDAHAGVALAPWLGLGQSLILLGSSGAGKSTLTNTLSSAGQLTGAARLSDGRGRHTTTARSLHLCSGGACIVDTPGLRTWRPDADEETVAGTFEDIAALALQCQFRDCRHAGEPGCAVSGAVDADRLRNYHKLLREVKHGQQTPLGRIEERAKWKVLVKAAQERGRHKRSKLG